MFENIVSFFKKLGKKDENKKAQESSKNMAKERLHLVLMQDRANVSADFLELMKQEIIDVIKKYIEVDENEIDVRLTNKENEDGENGAPALYANIPILNIKNENRKNNKIEVKETKKEEDKKQEIKKEIKTEITKKNTENKNDVKKKEIEEKQEEKEVKEVKEEKEEEKEVKEEKQEEKEIKEEKEEISENQEENVKVEVKSE